MLQKSLAGLDAVVGDSCPDGLSVADEDAAFRRPGDGSINKVALQHLHSRVHDGDNDSAVLASLALVDSAGIAKLQLVKVGLLVLNAMLGIVNTQTAELLADIADNTNVAIEHILLVAVLHLHDAVTLAEDGVTIAQ